MCRFYSKSSEFSALFRERLCIAPEVRITVRDGRSTRKLAKATYLSTEHRRSEKADDYVNQL